MIQIFKHINQIITLKSAHQKDGRNLLPDDLSLITDGAIVFDQNEIHWVGPTNKLPIEYNTYSHIDLRGFVVIPELVDSHTHLLFSGNRSKEFSQRLNGLTYQEIASLGGGIKLTSLQTNLTSEDKLFESCISRINQMYSLGVGTIEIKSGYGLNFNDEKKYSLLIDRLKKHFFPKVKIINTYMAAHAIPQGMSASDYIDQIVIPLLHELDPLKIIDFIDIFHEGGYFGDEHVYKLFNEAIKLGIPRKIHADEFVNNDGAQIAVDFNATSADHLLAISDENIELISKSNCVATILPGTALFLGKPFAPARKMLDKGSKLAIASDFNPGSCHFPNLLSIATIAAPSLKMNITELLAAITLNAAHALGLKQQGAIEVGLSSRFSIFKSDTYEEIFYNWGKNQAVTADTFQSF